MLSIFYKSALRSLWNKRAFSFLNIALIQRVHHRQAIGVGGAMIRRITRRTEKLLNSEAYYLCADFYL